jgi:glycosyltransferase involved in cell wall biosynthesis
LIDIKNPLFALQVARGVAARIGRRVSLGVLGSGPLEAQLIEQAAKIDGEVELRRPGFVAQADVPAWFASARVFLFPTSWDPWGVVANEACMAGVPVIVTPHAGAAGELVREGVNGFVRPLDLDQWIEAGANLLQKADLHARFSAQGRQLVRHYNFHDAARGIADASKMAFEKS